MAKQYTNAILITLVLLVVNSAGAESRQGPSETITSAFHEDDELSLLLNEEPLRRFKKQAIQRLAVSSGYLTEGENSSTHRWFATEIGTGIPLGNFENILATEVAFRNDVLTLPAAAFNRSDLYELSCSLFFKKPLSDKSNLLINVRPSYLGDFEATANTFGMFGMALITKQLESHDVTLSYGIVHLNQVDVALLPGIGVRWDPSPKMTVDLRFPESRISWRLDKNGGYSEHWLHASIGFGGNRWGIRTLDGNDTEIRLKYWSAALTLEKKIDGGGGWGIHLSHQFARRFSESGEVDFKLSNGFQIAAEIAY